MALLNKCCVYFDLANSAIQIARITMALSFFYIFLAMNALLDPRIFNYTWINDRVSIDDVNLLERIVNACYMAIIGFNFLNIIAGFLLLLAIKTRDRFLVLPWLVTNFISTAALIVTVLFCGRILLLQNRIPGIVLLVLGLPYSAINVYVWFCVVSVYQKIREEELLSYNIFSDYDRSSQYSFKDDDRTMIIVNDRPPVQIKIRYF